MKFKVLLLVLFTSIVGLLIGVATSKTTLDSFQELHVAEAPGQTISHINISATVHSSAMLDSYEPGDVSVTDITLVTKEGKQIPYNKNLTGLTWNTNKLPNSGDVYYSNRAYDYLKYTVTTHVFGIPFKSEGKATRYTPMENLRVGDRVHVGNRTLYSDKKVELKENNSGSYIKSVGSSKEPMGVTITFRYKVRHGKVTNHRSKVAYYVYYPEKNVMERK